MQTIFKKSSFGLIFIVLLLTLVACVNNDAASTQNDQLPSDTLMATDTSVPETATLAATATSADPTATPVPSETASPSPTLEPTPTLPPDTLTVEPSSPGLYLSLNTGLESLVSINISNDGRYLAASGQDGTLSVWDLTTTENLYNIDFYDLLMVLFSPDGSYLATLSSDWVELWQVSDGSLVADYPCSDELEMKIQFTPSGELAITGIIDETQVNLTYLASGDQLNFYAQNTDTWIKEATLSPDNQVIALGGSNGMIELYNVAENQLLWSIEAHADWVLNLAFSPDSQWIASDSISFDPSVKVWQVSDSTLVANPENEKWDAGRPAFSPDGSLLTSYSSYGTKLWRTDDWSLYAERPSFVRFSPDGVFFAEPDGKGAGIWDTSQAALVQSFAPNGLRDVVFPFSDPLPLVALGLIGGQVEIHQLDLTGDSTQVSEAATPIPNGDLFTAIDAAYGEMLGDQYVEWDESMQVYLIHGFADGQVNFDPLAIQSRQGQVLGTSLATLRLLNLHQGNQNHILVPLAIELPDGAQFVSGIGEPVTPQEMQDYLIFLREEEFLGRSTTVLIAPDVDQAYEATGLPDMPLQDALISTYQNSWEPEMAEMLETGQAVNINGQDLMLTPFQIWSDLFEPVRLP